MTKLQFAILRFLGEDPTTAFSGLKIVGQLKLMAVPYTDLSKLQNGGYIQLVTGKKNSFYQITQGGLYELNRQQQSAKPAKVVQT